MKAPESLPGVYTASCSPWESGSLVRGHRPGWPRLLSLYARVALKLEERNVPSSASAGVSCLKWGCFEWQR